MDFEDPSPKALEDPAEIFLSEVEAMLLLLLLLLLLMALNDDLLGLFNGDWASKDWPLLLLSLGECETELALLPLPLLDLLLLGDAFIERFLSRLLLFAVSALVVLVKLAKLVVLMTLSDLSLSTWRLVSPLLEYLFPSIETSLLLDILFLAGMLLLLV